jgi:hypothetical protein
MNVLLRRRGPICPTCGTAIRGEPGWFGLVRRYPGRCQACGARIAYDLAGGVYVVPEDDERAGDQKHGGKRSPRA